MKEKLKVLTDLFCVMFKVGLCTFGGGIAMLPILELELVEKRKWATSEELLDWFAIGQSTPGIIAVNVATFTGYKKAGVLGGCISTFGMVCPSLIIITVIALFINNFAELEWVQKALRGINVAVAAILTSAVYKFSKKSVKNIFGFVLLVISFLLIFVFNVGTIWIILGSCILGVVLASFRGEFKEQKEGEAK
ncbi:chromate transporter [uncultured Treponema sp.]|uniref:chromate transporter n=1 Tax=uncultured Treponema sp. TaxID=162155 RepID=UPI0015BAAF1D|nr:chromate transporter [uncultured Treponema sp.]